MEMKSIMIHSELIPCFKWRFARKKIRLPSPAVYHCSYQLYENILMVSSDSGMYVATFDKLNYWLKYLDVNIANNQ